MSAIDFNKHHRKIRILVAPLDWGLGHATRCIPIIKELINCQCEVYIAADKNIFFLLQEEFPSLVFLRCKGYGIKYARTKERFNIKMVSQFPKIFFSVWRENRWLKKVIRKYAIDGVISDNRFGMYSKKVPSVYITHQLYIQTGSRIADFIAQKIHYYFIKKYFQCWIPDNSEDGLAGALSHPKHLSKNTIYIGPLSRFFLLPGLEIVYDLLVTISGPEPQRSIFENKILNQLKIFSGKILLLRGLPSEDMNLLESTDSLKIVNHLPALELNKSILQSKMIIGRCGYTTVMDLAVLNRKAILIPTPGQTEQEYLGKYLLEKKYFFSVDEDDFSIKDALRKATLFEFKTVGISHEEYKKAIQEFVLSLKTVNFASQ